MARFLRVVRQARWFQYPDVDWLPSCELQSDALRDLETTDNTLSVYEVKSDADKARVALALAANRDHVDVFDYAVFDDSKFGSLGIIAGQHEGATPDVAVNAQHYNLLNLTVGRLARLAQVVSRGQLERIPKKVVKSRLLEAVNPGTLNKERLKPKLMDELQQAQS